MLFKVSKRFKLLLWQAAFLITGTSWLWAPQLNTAVSRRATLISQYEAPFQPYSWLFRGCDLLAGTLLALMAYKIINSSARTAGWLLLAISIGLMADPLLSTTCRMIGDTCQEYFSAAFLLHAIETVFTSSMFFVVALYDSYKRKRLVSIVFAFFQLLYGILFVTQLADKDLLDTLTQYIYQISLIVWTAWYCRDITVEHDFTTSSREKVWIKNLAAAWAFLNGVLAIVVSLAHINLLGRIKGIYLGDDTAWLAQHGIAVGVVMLYLSRHLARGEIRARQIFLLLTGVETLKYALISPHAGLLAFYSLTFCALFVIRDDFRRGSISLTWNVRLKDLYFLMTGLLLSAFIGLTALDRDNRASVITSRAVDNFMDYVAHNRPIPHDRLESVLLAHSISVFLLSSVVAVTWVLFRPYKVKRQPKDMVRVKAVLKSKSHFSEDFFKLWPEDKDYFWNPEGEGFIAYKIVGPIAFGLPDPISSKPLELVRGFNSWCERHRLKVCYLPVYPDGLKMYEKTGLQSQQIGSSALIDIDRFLNQTIRDKWWRWRINKAQKAGYLYKISWPPHSHRLLREMKKVSDSWLASGGHVERGFAMGYFDEKYLNQGPIHYLTDKNQHVIAFANELPQFKPQETMTIDMLRYSAEFSDSMAYLLYKIIEQAADDFKFFDLGFAPFAKASGPALSIARTFSAGRFSARGLEQFKNKFDPDWQPNYLVYDGDLGDLAVIVMNVEKLMERS